MQRHGDFISHKRFNYKLIGGLVITFAMASSIGYLFAEIYSSPNVLPATAVRHVMSGIVLVVMPLLLMATASLFVYAIRTKYQLDSAYVEEAREEPAPRSSVSLINEKTRLLEQTTRLEHTSQQDVPEAASVVAVSMFPEVSDQADSDSDSEIRRVVATLPRFRAGGCTIL